MTDRLLADGHAVVGLDNFCDFYSEDRKRQNIANAMGNERFTLIEIDLRDRDAVLELFTTHQPSSVFHLAAMAGVRPSIERPDYYTAVNINGTVNLLDGAAAVGTQRFVFTSSSSVYGNNPKAPFSEEDPVDHPISPYAATKKAGELICHTYHHLHQMAVVCVRLFTVFGPRQRPDLAISKFLKLVSDNQPIPMFGDGSTSRDYTFVGDIIDGFTRAWQQLDKPDGHRYRIYNIGGESPVSLKEMIATIGRVVGNEPIIEQQPMQPGDVQRTWADLSRSKAELGYQANTSLEDGIALQWEWMQEQQSASSV